MNNFKKIVTLFNWILLYLTYLNYLLSLFKIAMAVFIINEKYSKIKIDDTQECAKIWKQFLENSI